VTYISNAVKSMSRKTFYDICIGVFIVIHQSEILYDEIDIVSSQSVKVSRLPKYRKKY